MAILLASDGKPEGASTVQVTIGANDRTLLISGYGMFLGG